jgi:hypothetical protein
MCLHLVMVEVDMLHKTSYLQGFHIVATDGEIGHVDEFLVDETWSVRYLVVDVSNWPGGKSVLISPTAVQSINAPDKTIAIRLSREDVKNSPDAETANVELIETLPPVIM